MDLWRLAHEWVDEWGGGCHPRIHKLGFDDRMTNLSAAVLLNRSDVLACNGAYFHGVIEAEFAQSHAAPIIDTTRRTYRRVCTVPPSSYLVACQCAHGIGHGVLRTANYEMPTALRVCEIASPTPDDAGLCINGAWHDFVLHLAHQSTSEYVMSVCERYKSLSCARYAPTAHMRFVSNIDNATDWCMGSHYQYLCEEGVGYRAYKTHPGDHMELVERACRGLSHCIRSALETHRFMFPYEMFNRSWCASMRSDGARGVCMSV